MSASVFAEPGLLAVHRAEASEASVGPQRVVAAVTDYLRAEQRHGRVAAGIDCAAAASLLLGACSQYAFLRCFDQRRPRQEEINAQAESLIAMLNPALTR